MVVGLIQYTLGRKYLGEAGLRPADPGTVDGFARQKREATRWLGGGIAGLGLFGFGVYTGILPVTAKQIADAAGFMLLGLSVGFFAWAFLSGGWTRVERNHLILIGVLFVGYALFASSFEQAGSTLNLFADRNTDNRLFGWSFPSSWFQSVNALFVIVFAPVFAWLWVKLAASGKEPGAPFKFGIGLLLVGLGFAVLIPPSFAADRGALVGPGWLILTYLLHTWGELALSPVGLSAMSKLAPVRIGGLVMGVWFLGTSVGNFLGGGRGRLFEKNLFCRRLRRGGRPP